MASSSDNPMPTRQAQWPRFVMEGVVIVASILLAFGIEAWWDLRGESLAAESRLEAVQTELGEARNGYAGHLTQLDTQDSLAVLILREVSQYSGSAARLDTLLWRLGPPPEYSPPMSAYGDATSTGSLSLITSDALRRALAEYRVLVEDDTREQAIARAGFDTRMVPLWLEYVSTRDHFDVAKGFPSWVGFVPDLPTVPFASDYPGLLQDRRFSSNVVGRTFLVSRVRIRHHRVLEAIDDVLDLIDAY